MTAFDPTTLAASDLAARMRDGLSARSVMEAVLDRIETLNPHINAIVSLRPREGADCRGRCP